MATSEANQREKGKAVHYYPLEKLDFDAQNPRFGRSANQARSQREILDYIVQDFGIDDVLSSIAVNGYFLAEPLICRAQENSDRLTVVEGNRRLAACLILAHDSRAANQGRKQEHYSKIQAENQQAAFADVPILRFQPHEQEKDLLAYLGVRHLAPSQGWDSYAKAAWIARVVDGNRITLNDIAMMTGDQHGTIRRLLEGYYFINQLVDVGKFIPETSLRKGRGSNKQYPFSWVYTILGYPTARQFLALPPEPIPNPLRPEKIEDASLLISALFGDNSQGRSAAISDSRQIGRLAGILDDPEKVAYLKRGKSIEEIEYQTQAIANRLRDGLTDCKDILSELMSAIHAEPISAQLGEEFFPLAKKVQNLSATLLKTINHAQLGLEE